MKPLVTESSRDQGGSVGVHGGAAGQAQPSTGACAPPGQREEEEQGSWLSLGSGNCRMAVALGRPGGWRMVPSGTERPPGRMFGGCFRVTKAARASYIPSGGRGGGEKGRKGGRGEERPVLGQQRPPPHTPGRGSRKETTPRPQLEPCSVTWFLLCFQGAPSGRLTRTP